VFCVIFACTYYVYIIDITLTYREFSGLKGRTSNAKTRSPSCPCGITEPGPAIVSRARPVLSSVVGTRGGELRVAPPPARRRLVLGARKSSCGRSADRRPAKNAKGKWVLKSAQIAIRAAMPFPFIPTLIGPVQPRGRHTNREGGRAECSGHRELRPSLCHRQSTSQRSARVFSTHMGTGHTMNTTRPGAMLSGPKSGHTFDRIQG